MRYLSRAAIFGSVCALLLCVSAAQAQELLTNANLNDVSVSTQVLPTPTNWSVSATRAISGVFNDGASSEPWCNVPAGEPNAFGLFFKPFTGNVNDGPVSVVLSQSRPGQSGLPYTLTGYAGAEANYIGMSDPTVQSLFRLQFLSAANVLLSEAVLDLKAAGLGDPNGQPFNYRQFSLSAIAPAGTAFVRSSAEMLGAYGNPAGGGQAFVVDAFSLTVPEPASLGLVVVGALALAGRRRGR